MRMVRFAVCDDECFMLEDIKARLSEYLEEKKLSWKISCFGSGMELLASGETFDAVFLDIQMTAPDGMETARRLRERGFGGLLVFITVLGERVFDSFGVEAFDYLVKPPDSGIFRRMMDRMIKRLEREDESCVIVRKGHSCELVPFSRIVYCEVLGRKIYIHGQDGKVVDYYEKLGELEKHMDGRFFRCHRSYLVNLDFVRGCREGLVVLTEGCSIPVSRLRERELVQALLVHMKERRC